MTCSRQVITYVHVAGMELGLNSLPDNMVHVSGFGEENLNIFGVNTMFCVEVLFCYCQYYWLSEAGVPFVFFQSCLNVGPPSLSNVISAVLPGYTLHIHSLEYQVILDDADSWFPPQRYSTASTGSITPSNIH